MLPNQLFSAGNTHTLLFKSIYDNFAFKSSSVEQSANTSNQITLVVEIFLKRIKTLTTLWRHLQ